jgi:hypothetical protein
LHRRHALIGAQVDVIPPRHESLCYFDADRLGERCGMILDTGDPTASLQCGVRNLGPDPASADDHHVRSRDEAIS